MATIRRTFVLLLSAALLLAGGMGWYFYLHYSDPETVRRLVLEWARKTCPNAKVDVDSASASLLDGVKLRNIHLCVTGADGAEECLSLDNVSVVPNRASLLRGKLVAERVKLHRPNLRLHQYADGSWNLARLLTGRPIRFANTTTIAIEDAVLQVTFDDPRRPTAEFDGVTGEVRLTSPGNADWELVARHPVAKDFQINGSADFVENRASVVARTKSPLDLTHLRIHLPEELRERMAELRDLSGAVHLRAVADAQKKGSVWEWDGSIGGTLEQVSAMHDVLPYPIREAQGTFLATREGLTVNSIECLIGPSKAVVAARVPSWDLRRAEASGVVQNLELTPAVRKTLHDKGQKLWDRFHPTGFVDIEGRLVRLGEKFAVAGHADLRDCSFRFDPFPYQVDGVRGRASLADDGKVDMALTGRAKSAEVDIKGTMDGMEPPLPAQFVIRAANIPLDEDLLRALPPGPAQVVRDMRPGATTGDIVCKIVRPAGNPKFFQESEIDVRSAEASYIGFPYRVQNVRGHLSVSPQRVVFRDVTGEADGAAVRISGQSITQTDGVHLELGILAEGLPLDEKLVLAMPKAWQDPWRKLNADGRANVACNVVRAPGAELFLEMEIDPAAASIQPDVFPYRIDSFNGRVSYRNKVVAWEPVSFRHGGVAMTCSGSLALEADGGVLELREFSSNNLVYDDALRKAAPPSLRKTLEFLQPTKPVGVRFPQIRVAWANEPRRNWEIALDGGIAMQGSSLLQGEKFKNVSGVVWYRGECVNDVPRFAGNIDLSAVDVHGFRANKVRSSFKIEGDAFEMPNIRGDMYGGQIHGSVRASTGPVGAHECRFNLYGGRLRDYARSHLSGDSTIDGLVYLDLFLEGKGSYADRLWGRGKLDVLEADIDRLPLLQDLFRIGNLQPPEGKAFEEVTGNFRIDDSQIAIEKLELLGPANIVGPSFNLVNDGEGTLRLDTREIEMMLAARWGRGRFRVPILTPSFNLANDQVWSFQVRGKLDDPIITPAPLKGFFRMLDGPRNSTIGRRAPPPNAIPVGQSAPRN